MMKIIKKKWWWSKQKVFEREREPEFQCTVEEIGFFGESELYP